jgi:penicillin-insensitive murein endopeptidase
MRPTRFLGAILLLIAIALPDHLTAEPTHKTAASKAPGHAGAKEAAAPAAEQKDAATETKSDAKTDIKSKKSAAKKKDNSPVAKTLFGVQKTASPLAARAVGWYSKGCLSGGVHLDDAGPTWQTMRPARNRAWGHPKLIALLKRLANDAKQKDGWSGLLVGDISQPRGGPMLSGHASHQVGLDADIWFNPMPDHVMSVREREDTSAKTMLDSTKLKVDPKMFTDKQVALLRRAASYPEVERIFVNPAIKKALCERSKTDRHWLGKVRPMWGHDYHFHIRIGCTNSGCTAQPVPNGDDGCGKEVDNWLKIVAKSLSKEEPKPGQKIGGGASDMRMITMNQLPAECKTVLNSAGYFALAPGTKLPTFVDAAAPPAPDPAPAKSRSEAAATAKAASDPVPAPVLAEKPLPSYRGVAPKTDQQPAEASATTAVAPASAADNATKGASVKN